MLSLHHLPDVQIFNWLTVLELVIQALADLEYRSQSGANPIEIIENVLLTFNVGNINEFVNVLKCILEQRKCLFLLRLKLCFHITDHILEMSVHGP